MAVMVQVVCPALVRMVPVPRPLDHELCGGEDYAREYVDDNLLRHAVVDCAGENYVAAQQAGEEGIVVSFPAGRGCVS